MLVKRQRDQFLTSAAVTRDQHGRLGIGDFFYKLQHIANRLALADNVVEMKFHSSQSGFRSSFRAAVSPVLASRLRIAPLRG